jgi:hypothetical protein
MKKNNLMKLATMTLGTLAIMAAMNACRDLGANDSDLSKVDPQSDLSILAIKPIGPPTATECTVTEIKNNATWTKINQYILYGDIRVKAGATLTIQAGTVIKGDKASKGTLTIEKGAKISAVGTFDEPIVFTSTQAPGSRAPRDWGGIIILGDAPSNKGVNQIPEGYPACVVKPLYGGTNCADNSGKMTYVRIEFAGVPVTSGDEKNSLSLYGVGSGTVINHIQASYGGDDSFEWFGGCVNATHLISFGTTDDDFDSDNGFSGSVQFGVALRDPSVADNSQSNGFESDNDATGSGALPQTSGVFSNFTLIGPYDPGCARTVVNTATNFFGDGLHLRRNTGLDVHNAIITGWPKNQAFIANGVTGVVLSNNTAVKPANVAASLCFTEPVAPNNAWTSNASNLCNDATLCTTSATSGLGMLKKSGLTINAWNLSAPSVQPYGGSPVLKNGTDATALSTFFVSNATTGAVGETTFFRGARRYSNDNGWKFSKTWVNWDPQNTVYP